MLDFWPAEFGKTDILFAPFRCFVAEPGQELTTVKTYLGKLWKMDTKGASLCLCV